MEFQTLHGYKRYMALCYDCPETRESTELSNNVPFKGIVLNGSSGIILSKSRSGGSRLAWAGLP